MSASNLPYRSPSRLLHLPILLVLLASNCKKPDPIVVCPTFGDPTQPMQLVVGETRLQLIVASDPINDKITHAEFVPLASGDAIDLYLPPQGGHVSYLGARITNVKGCNITMRSSIFDITSGDRIQFEERNNTNLIAAADAPSWGEPDPYVPSSWDNVPLCPDYLNADIVDQPFRLRVDITDGDGRTATASVDKVIPRCNEADPHRRAVCQCECPGHYFLGKCSFADGGTPTDAATDAANWDAR